MRAWWKKRKGRIIGATALALLVGALLAPWLLWKLARDRPMDVLVVDKSIARPDYRKHAGLFWLMRHEKIVARDTGRPLAPDRDYVGYHPRPTGLGTQVPIPQKQHDLVYLSDTYGVYEDDLADRPLGVRSKRVYGGLSLEEARTVLDDVRPGGTLVGEFNCIATPTTGAARALLSDAFGVRPTGWVGRHFQFLDLTADLPQWIPRGWLAATGERWTFRGPGYVFVHEDGRMVVLLEGIDTPMRALDFVFDRAQADRLGALERLPYDYWVEVMEPTGSTEVLASYEFTLTASGRDKMRGVPIAGRWPAVLRTTSSRMTTYYFAGDYADRPRDGRVAYKWLPRLKRMIAPQDRDDQERFFLSVYVPLMQDVLRETERNLAARAS